MVALAAATLLRRVESHRRGRVTASRSVLAESERAAATSEDPELVRAKNVGCVNTAAQRTAEFDRLRRLRHQSNRSTHRHPAIAKRRTIAACAVRELWRPPCIGHKLADVNPERP